MNTTLNKKNQGFTIIEVVLVLAIAGLIFLIVFLALPQLQASRRDTQRKNDAGRLVAALENWAGNHSGNYPTDAEMNGTTGAAWATANIAGNWADPDGGAYDFEDAWATTLTEGQVVYNQGAACHASADGWATGTFTARQVGVVMALENGQYCQDNQ